MSNAAALPLDNLRPHGPSEVRRAAALAVLAHGVLLLGLGLNLNWHTQTPPEAVVAELWDALPRAAAPRAETPPPPPAEPAPPPDTRAAQARATAAAQAQAQQEADIALMQARKAEKLAQAKAKHDAELKAQQAEAEAQKKAQAQERAKQAAEAKQAAADAKRQALAAKRALQEAEQRDAAEHARADAALASRLRDENLRRMQQGLANSSGAPTDTGTAAQSSGPSTGYKALLIARIKPNIYFALVLPGNPVAEVEVRAAPDGTILSRRIVRPSGHKEWDEAVLKAIDRTDTLPRDTNGRVPTQINISFSPLE